MQPITPCLWFDDQAEQAARYYTGIFPRSKVGAITYYGDAGPRPAGSVLTVSFELDGQAFTALNGGPEFKFSPAISLVVKCETQAEVDRYWEQLSAVPEKEMCGWIEDRYGVSWQIVPAIVESLITDPARSNRVLAAIMTMKKLDIAALQRA